jgi:hypothetical protein
MPKLSITINSVPLPVYQKNDIWRGGMVAFGRAERCLDDYSSRRLVKTAEVSGYYQCEYLLEEHTLLTSWSSEKPETIAEMVGPDPSLAWAKGTITTTTGNKHEIEYKLIPHTKEQAEKVFRERMIDEAAKRHATADAMAEQLRELKQKVTGDAQRQAEAAAVSRRHAAKAVAKPDEKATREPKPAPEYVFRRRGATGDFWQIVFEGRELPPVRHVAGMTYLHAVLARPGHTFAALDLYKIENPPPPDNVAPSKDNALDWEDREQYGIGGSQHTVMDATMRQDIAERIDELMEMIEDPALDLEEKNECRDELRTLDKARTAGHVAAATGGVTFEDRDTKRQRQTVAKAIGKALDVLVDQSGSLVKHLALIRKGRNLVYTGGLNWET